MKRSAFTLVELLVVITVIVILASILVPAVSAARESARRSMCLSRQRDIAIAMKTYNNDNNGLPGYLNEFGTTPIHSWAVSIFPMIGEHKRHDVLMTGQAPAEALTPLPALLCPSDNPDESKRVNYVVNCGPVEENGIKGDMATQVTLYKDRRASLTTINKKVLIEEIPNGASNTVLLSENVNAGFWHKTWTDPDELETGLGRFLRSRDAVNNLGFIWSRQRSFAPNSPTKGPRPSSRHPATVVVAYADCRVTPMDDDIDITVYLKVVCGDSKKMGL